jgi:hypothetical protein
MATATDSPESHRTQSNDDNNTSRFDRTPKEPLLDHEKIVKDQITRRFV